jgi:hypothetical protein
MSHVNPHESHRETAFRHETILLMGILVAAAMSPEILSAGTYYLRADGTAYAKGEATGCGSSSTAMSVGTHNGQNFTAGDTIVLCDGGGVYRETIWIPSSGGSGAPVVYDGRGTAVITGADPVSGWTRESGDVYKANLSSPPSQVFINDEFGDRKASRGSLSNNLDWYWSSGTLYLYSSGGDPDTVYSNPGIEATVRDICIGFGEADSLVFEGITVRRANYGFNGWNPGSHVTIRNCVAEWHWETGIDFSGEVSYTDALIEDNIVRYNGTGGIALLGPGGFATIRRNTCYENGTYQSRGNEYNPQHEWTFGIKLWEDTAEQQGIEIYHNEVYGNGRDQAGDYQGRGVGIWLDGSAGNPNYPNIIRHNLIHNNTGNGIFHEIANHSVTYGNVLYNNATNTGGDEEFAAANIAIDSRNGWTSANNLVYNNTCYGGRVGIKIVTYACGGCSVDDNIVMNNIAVGASEHNLYANFGGENDGNQGSGNIYEVNNFGEESNNFISWGGNDYDTYAAWDSAYGTSSNSIEGDPKLAGVNPRSLYLTSDSPCRDAGVTLGPDYDDALSSSSSWTGGVATVDHDSLGIGWEVGAYGYSGASAMIFSDGLETGELSRWSGISW